MIDSTSRYDVYTYDLADDPSEEGNWTERAICVPARVMMEQVRYWEQWYDRDVSILVQRHKALASMEP